MPREIRVKSVLNKSKKRDSWFLSDYSVNLYSGCSFNCFYCYIRGSKYGENLETSLSVKSNALEVLDRQLYNRAKKGEFGYIVLSSSTDSYIRLEEKLGMTREALKLISFYRFPIHVITKSDLIERDFDLLNEISVRAHRPYELNHLPGTIISYSFSTLEDDIGQQFEPGAPLPSERLRSHQLALKEGFKSGISLMPLLPYITDTKESLHHLFQSFSDAGSHYLLPGSITLFGKNRADSFTLVKKVIKEHYPLLSEKYDRFFHEQSEMPEYYIQAFNKKMQELSLQYGIRLCIDSV